MTRRSCRFCLVLAVRSLLLIKDSPLRSSLYDMRMAQEVDGDVLGDQFAGYRFRINGGNDKQGFPMMQGVLTPNRVKLLLNDSALS